MKCVWLVILFACTSVAQAQPAGFNYDESKVPDYELPELLQTNAGNPVTTAADWQKVRRSEILEMFRTHVYGRVPEDAVTKTVSVIQEESDEALGGTAVRRQVRLYLKARGEEPFIDVLIYLPKSRVEEGKSTPIFTASILMAIIPLRLRKKCPFIRNGPEMMLV